MEIISHLQAKATGFHSGAGNLLKTRAGRHQEQVQGQVLTGLHEAEQV